VYPRCPSFGCYHSLPRGGNSKARDRTNVSRMV
jgi:hypothetical protein